MRYVLQVTICLECYMMSNVDQYVSETVNKTIFVNSCTSLKWCTWRNAITADMVRTNSCLFTASYTLRFCDELETLFFYSYLFTSLCFLTGKFSNLFVYLWKRLYHRLTMNRRCHKWAHAGIHYWWTSLLAHLRQSWRTFSNWH